MKNFCGVLLTLFVCVCTGAAAQQVPDGVILPSVVGVELQGDTLIYRTVAGSVVEDGAGQRYRLRPLKDFSGPRQSFALEIGAYPLCGTRSIVPETGCCEPYFGAYPGAFPGEQRFYEGPLRMSGALSAVYAYRVRRWLEVGASLSYAGFYRTLRYSDDRSIAARQREHYLTVMPFARFSWLNRHSVRLYSALQAGCQLGIEKYFFSHATDYGYFALQITPVGISVGRRLFGYAELGIGMRGIVVCGVGYRFGKTQK